MYSYNLLYLLLFITISTRSVYMESFVGSSFIIVGWISVLCIVISGYKNLFLVLIVWSLLNGAVITIVSVIGSSRYLFIGIFALLLGIISLIVYIKEKFECGLLHKKNTETKNEI